MCWSSHTGYILQNKSQDHYPGDISQDQYLRIYSRNISTMAAREGGRMSDNREQKDREHRRNGRTQRTRRTIICMRRMTLVFTLFVMLVALGGRNEAHAARYTTKKEGVDLHVYRDGAFLASLFVRTASINEHVAVKGDKIYCVSKPFVEELNQTLLVYDLNTKKYAVLGYLPKDFYQYDIVKIYKGKIYLNGWNPSDNNALFTWKLSTGSLKKVVNAAFAQQYKQYMICEPSMTSGSWTPLPLYVYNAKSGKKVRLTKKMGGYSLNGKYIYFAVKRGASRYENKMTFNIYRYNIATGAKKKLASAVEARYIGKITSKYVYWKTVDYPDNTFYRYNMRTKKKKVLSESAYKKAVGNS